jgi:hypothetical protein
MDAVQPCPSSYLIHSLTCEFGSICEQTHLAAGYFSDSFRVLFDVFLPAAPRMACTNKLGVVLEARRDRLAPMSVALDKLDDLGLLLADAPLVKSFEVGEDEGVAVVGVARAVWEFRRSGLILSIILELCSKLMGGAIGGRMHLVLDEMGRQRLAHGELAEPEMLETHWRWGVRTTS